MNKWYFEKNGRHQTLLALQSHWWVFVHSADPQVQASVALVFHAISRHSPDTAGSVMTDFIPLVFLAMHAKTSDEGIDVFVR